MFRNKDIISIVCKVLIRQSKIKIGFGLSFVAYATLMVVFSNGPISWVKWFFILALLSGGIYLLFRAIMKFQPVKHDVYHVFNSRLKEIVWVHHHITQVMPFGVFLFERYILYVYLLDGSCHQIFGKKEEVLNIMKHLKETVNNASFGYSVDKEQLFKANPALLYRDD